MKSWLRRHWPSLRLRTILFGVFLFVATLPGVSAVLLRVYENTLVRQTESELIAQGSALVAAAGGRFAGDSSELIAQGSALAAAAGGRSAGNSDERTAPNYYQPEPPTIDLSQSDISADRPDPEPALNQPDADDRAMAERMQPIITQTGRTTLASIILINPQGLILTGSYAGGSYAHVPEVQAAMRGEAVTLLRRNASYQARYDFEWLSRAAAVRVHHARPIIVEGKVRGVLLLSRSSRALFRGMYQDRGRIGLGIVLIFGTLVLLTLFLHRTIAKPIEALSRATRALGEGRGDIPEPPATAASEIRALYSDYGAMAEVIAVRSRYLRDFASALAHEFKTPLAGLRGGIELIEDHHGSMSEADRARFLGNMSADTERLSALVSRLLDLARADMARPEAGVATDLAQALPRLADAMRSDGFAVSVALPDGPARAAISPQAFETILIGMMENSRQAGASEVQISARVDNDELCVLVADNGGGIAEADQQRMFEPFFTTRRSEGGTGLGLSIARSLLAAHQARIDLLPGGSGAVFEIWLRPAE